MQVSLKQHELKCTQSQLYKTHPDFYLFQKLKNYQEKIIKIRKSLGFFGCCDMTHSCLHSESGNVLPSLLVDTEKKKSRTGGVQPFSWSEMTQRFCSCKHDKGTCWCWIRATPAATVELRPELLWFSSCCRPVGVTSSFGIKVVQSQTSQLSLSLQCSPFQTMVHQ